LPLDSYLKYAVSANVEIVFISVSVVLTRQITVRVYQETAESQPESSRTHIALRAFVTFGTGGTHGTTRTFGTFRTWGTLWTFRAFWTWGTLWT